MDFRIVRRLGHFLAVAEEGHFGRAAARLGLSQPPLTAQIQALEAELGVRLLERTRKGARPTREGEALLPIVRRLAEDARQVEEIARELRAGRHAPMALASVTSALFDFLPPLVRALRAELPDAAMSVTELDTSDAVEALKRGEIDFALVRLDADRPPLRVLVLGDEAMLVALPEAHPLAPREAEGEAPLPLSALAEEPLIALPRSINPSYFDRLISACRQAGFEPHTVREVSSAMAQLSFVAAGLGVALVSAGTARLRPQGVAFRELADPVESVPVALVWNAERETDAARAAVRIAARLFNE